MIAALVSASQSAPAQDALPLAEIINLPCRTYIATYGTEVYPYLIEPLIAYFTAREDVPSAFGAACNIPNYVRSECLLHPRFRVGDAISTLAMIQSSRRPLPLIPKCNH